MDGAPWMHGMIIEGNNKDQLGWSYQVSDKDGQSYHAKHGAH